MTIVLVHLAKCIDLYIKLSVHNATASTEDMKDISENLEAVVNRMFQRCFDDRQFRQVTLCTAFCVGYNVILLLNYKLISLCCTSVELTLICLLE